MKIFIAILFSSITGFVFSQTPINDDCVNSISLTPASSCISTTATLNGALPSSTALAYCTGGQLSGDVWFKFTATSTGNLIKITGNSFDVGFQIISSCTGTTIACVDINPTGVSESHYNNNFVPGNTYYIRVFAYNTSLSTGGNFNICVQNIPPPSNDDCVNSLSLTTTSSCITTAGSLNGATPSSTTLPYCIGSQGYGDVWFKFTALSTGNLIKITGNSFDVAFQVLTSCNGTAIACVDNNSTGVSESYYDNTFIPGNTYYIRVFANYTSLSTTGSFNICVQNVPPPSNDDCTNSTSLTPNFACVTTSATLNGATPSPTTLSSCSGVQGKGDVWFKFTALSSGNLITVSNNLFDAAFQVLSSCSGTTIACVDNNSAGVSESYYNNTFIPGNTYFVRVFAYNTSLSTTGAFNICVQNVPPPANDDCVNSVSLTPGSSCISATATLNGATSSSTTLPICSLSQGYGDIWFKFTALTPGNFISVFGNSFDIAFQVLTSCTGTAIACVNNNVSNTGESFSGSNFIAGNTYYVRVFAYGTSLSTNGGFQICVQNISAPVAQFTTNSSFQICAGKCINYSDLSQGLPTSWSWQFQGASVTTSTLQNPTNICYNTPGSYTVSLTAINSTSSSVMVKTITVLPSPIITASSSSSAICVGQSAVLSALGANTYTWSTGANTQSISVNPIISTNYSVVGTNSLGCNSTTIINTITVNQNPTISVNSGAICSGGAFTINPSGASTYTISGGSNVVSPGTTTSYSVSGTSAQGCVGNIAISTVSVQSSLIVSISGSTSICKGQSVNLTANGAASYTWNTGVTGNSITQTPSVNTTYSVIGASSTCSNTAIYTVIVNPTPTITAVSNTSLLCIGQSATLSANGASTYTWNPGGTGSSISISPSVTTTYNITGQGLNGCLNSTSFTQLVSVCTELVGSINSQTNNLKIYPNPVSDVMIIELGQFDNGFVAYRIVDVFGNVLMQNSIHQKIVELNVENFKSGIYFVEVHSYNTRKVVKWIKK